jgi:hypothetical protein
MAARGRAFRPGPVLKFVMKRTDILDCERRLYHRRASQYFQLT